MEATAVDVALSSGETARHKNASVSFEERTSQRLLWTNFIRIGRGGFQMRSLWPSADLCIVLELTRRVWLEIFPFGKR